MTKNFKFVYLMELEFPNDKPNKELIEELTKLAFLRGASLNIVDEFYREKKVQP